MVDSINKSRKKDGVGPVSGPDKITEILQERGNSYGDANIQFALAQVLKGAMRGQITITVEDENGINDEDVVISPDIIRCWQNLPAVVRESVDMIMLKISRVVCGDFKHLDSWRDIVGYAQLAQTKIDSDN